MAQEFMIPPWVRISGGRYDFISNTAAFPSTFTGAIRTTDRLGDRVAVSFNTQNASHREDAPTRALLSSLRARMRGQSGRIWYTDPGYVARGAMGALAVELLDSTFATGASLTASNTNVSVAVQDRTLRSTRTNTASLADTTLRASGKTTVQYAPYVARTMGIAGRGAMDFRVRLGTSPGGADVAALTSDLTANGMAVAAGVSQGTTTHFSILDGVGSIREAGDYMDFPYVSLARCALIDNGPNLVLRSEEYNDAAWTKVRTTIQPNNTTAPDGSSNADRVNEDSSASTTHFVTQAITVASTALDYCHAVALKANTRTWGVVSLEETTGGTGIRAYFDLANGVQGSVVAGVNWANGRSFMRSLGNGWWYCCVIGRKTNAATTVSAQVQLATGDLGQTYTGDGTSSIYAWRSTPAQASVPVRLVQTTTTASTGTSQTGPGYYTRGWPVSTSGLLLPDDWVQIGNQLNRVVAPVDSDAAGLAYLQLAYPLRTAPSDAAPVIIHQPFGRFVSVENQGGYDFMPGGFSSHDFNLVEDLAA